MLCYNFSGEDINYMDKYLESVGMLINDKEKYENERYDVYSYITYTSRMRANPGPGGKAAGPGVCNPDPSERLSITQAYGDDDCNLFKNDIGMEKVKDCTIAIRIALISEVMYW